MSLQPLQGVLVVSLEHAVAAPYCSSRLANAGARVIKIERPEGDFARDYDREVYGESSYFVWINQGKESLALDLKREADRQRMRELLAQADAAWATTGCCHMARARLSPRARQIWRNLFICLICQDLRVEA